MMALGIAPHIPNVTKIFERLDCVKCHKPPLYTTPKAYEVGLEDERGETLFNPPSLRDLRFRSGLFHDKRASSIEDVVRHKRHQILAGVSESELATLIAFLRSL